MSNELIIANKEDLVSIADAIREKAGIEDGMSFPDGFLEAVEGIGASGVIIGEIIPSEGITTIDFSQFNGFTWDFDNAPRARFLLEKNMSLTDNSHTSRRVIAVLEVSTDESKKAPTYQRSYYSVALYQLSGETNPNTSAASVSSMWQFNASSGSTAYNIISGETTAVRNTLCIAAPETSWGPIAGRTYIWGVIM